MQSQRRVASGAHAHAVTAPHGRRCSRACTHSGVWLQVLTRMQPVEDIFLLDGVPCAACARDRRRCACSLDLPRCSDVAINGAPAGRKSQSGDQDASSNTEAPAMPPPADISKSAW